MKIKIKLKSLLIIVVLFFIDLIIKLIIENNILNISYIKNSKIFLGSFYVNNNLIIIFSLIILVIICYLFKKYKNLRLSLIIITAGIIGNLFDRIFYSYVIDYIDLKIIPVFNLADLYATLGIILLIYNLIKKQK
jgi:signal peptidase II